MMGMERCEVIAQKLYLLKLNGNYLKRREVLMP